MGISAQDILAQDPEVLRRQMLMREMQTLNPQGTAAGAIGALLGRGLGNVASGQGFFAVNDPALQRAAKVRSIQTQIAQSGETDPTKLATLFADELAKDPELAPFSLQVRSQIRPTAAEKPVTVSAGQSIVNPSTGEVIYSAPKKSTKTENKVLPPGAVLVDNEGNVIAEGRAARTEESPELRKYNELVRMGLTPERARAIAYKTESIDFRRELQTQKEEDAKAASKRRLRNTIEKIDRSIPKLRTAIDQVSPFTAGLGSVLSVVPGTSARDLEANISTVKSNLGFDELQKMRDESPTGGALGQVAVQEINFLQSVIDNLDTGQSAAQLKRNLESIERHYARWRYYVTNPEAEPLPPGEFPPNYPQRKSSGTKSIKDLSDDELMKELEKSKRSQR